MVIKQDLPSKGRDDLMDGMAMRVMWATSVVSPVSNSSFIFEIQFNLSFY
jgi:hypothetical protein